MIPLPQRRVVVVVVLTTVVVVVVAHGLDVGWQLRVIVSLSVPAFAWITHLPAFLPCFFRRTLTPANPPHTELVPFPLACTLPTGPQCPEARMFLCFRLTGVQPSVLTHTWRLKVHSLPLAVWQRLAPSVTAAPLVCSLNWSRHSCARLVRGERATSATADANATTSAAALTRTPLPELDLRMPQPPSRLVPAGT